MEWISYSSTHTLTNIEGGGDADFLNRPRDDGSIEQANLYYDPREG